MKIDFTKVCFSCSLCNKNYYCLTKGSYNSKKYSMKLGKDTFCSKSCRNKALSLAKKIYPKKVGECLRCKKDIIIESADMINSKLGYRMYCGKSCKASTENVDRVMGEKQKMAISARKTIHGHSKKPLFKVWLEIKRRCESDRSGQYKNYGGRGIQLSQEWHNFETFEKWASINGYVKGLTIERIDVNGNYEEKNCTWIPRSQQSKNRRPSNKWSFKKRIET